MKLTILGSGTCVPSGERNSAGYFVETDGLRMMLDCGAGTVHALARYGLPWEELTHLFVSHFHVDHIGELPALMFAFRWGMSTVRSRELCIAGPRGLDDVIRKLDDALGPRLFDARFPVRTETLNPGTSFEIGPDARLSVFKTPHTEESLGFRIDCDGKSLGYTGDTAYSDEVADFFADVDLLISECSYITPRAGVRHLAVAEVAKLAARAKARRLVVTHFYFKVDDVELKHRIAEQFAGKVIVGRDGVNLAV
jgi:ribonuclease BN (tRNA processing enzyme)